MLLNHKERRNCLQLSSLVGGVKVDVKKCKDCEIEIDSRSIRCNRCASKEHGVTRRKVERPSKDELETLITQFSWVQLGKRFGVSNNAVKKWAIQYNLI
jgi:hypothetical protein